MNSDFFTEKDERIRRLHQKAADALLRFNLNSIKLAAIFCMANFLFPLLMFLSPEIKTESSYSYNIFTVTLCILIHWTNAYLRWKIILKRMREWKIEFANGHIPGLVQVPSWPSSRIFTALTGISGLIGTCVFVLFHPVNADNTQEAIARAAAFSPLLFPAVTDWFLLCVPRHPPRRKKPVEMPYSAQLQGL